LVLQFPVTFLPLEAGEHAHRIPPEDAGLHPSSTAQNPSFISGASLIHDDTHRYGFLSLGICHPLFVAATGIQATAAQTPHFRQMSAASCSGSMLPVDHFNDDGMVSGPGEVCSGLHLQADS